MQHIVLFWNRLYFGFFEYNRVIQLFLYRMVVWLFQRLKIKRNNHIETMHQNVIAALSDMRCSTILLIADYTMIAFAALSIWTIINFISVLFPYISLTHLNKITFCIVTAIPVLSINYLFLWRKDKYLEYFKTFQKSSPRLNRLWCFVSIMCLLIMLALFIYSLIIM